jgi:ferric-dicitrate binding protein FerR (iron transport regulator)
LHVLSEHGDPSATAAAVRWMAGDSEARRVWDEVERIRDQLRAPPL